MANKAYGRKLADHFPALRWLPQGPGNESNWLPTPQQGPFRPIMRLYQPQQPVLDGSFTLPGIIRVD